MKKLFLITLITSGLLLFLSIFILPSKTNNQLITGAPPYDPGGGNVPDNADFSWLNNWKRPDGPTSVALQVGHWKNDEVPEELHKLKGNTGASSAGYSEWEVNYEIAMLTKDLLEKRGIKVTILPATVPKRFYADVFVSIHADGSENPSKSGYKAAAPRRDIQGKATSLVEKIEKNYQIATGLEKDPNITRNMTGYYAFSWRRYEHSVHPMTTSAILETGFLSNNNDRQTIVNNPSLSAKGLADGIIEFLKEENML